MTFAKIAVNVNVPGTFDYHLKPAMDPMLQPGHLVQVPFRTAVQPGVVIALHNTPPTDSAGNPIMTKPVLDIIDPQPVVTVEQITLAEWISTTYLAPMGLAIWLMLPPGIAGKRDIRMSLIDESARGEDALQEKILTALHKSKTLTGTQIQRRVKNKAWNKGVQVLRERGAIYVESMLTPPTVKAKKMNVVSLGIHPERINDTVRYLGKGGKPAELLERIITLHDDEGQAPTVETALAVKGLAQGTLDKLIEADYVTIDDENRVQLAFDLAEADHMLYTLRGGQTDLHILQLLARHSEPVDVSWVYAQTHATSDDLKRLAERGYVQLGEQRDWRDSLAERDFVPIAPPRLSEGQRVVWRVLREALNPLSVSVYNRIAAQNPLLASPVDRGGTDTPSNTVVDKSAGDDLTELKQPTASGESTPSPSTGRDGVGSGATSHFTTYLLHGVTGSGKTEIYLRAIERVIAQGRQAIFLVPEIALTAQTIRRVMARFPGQVDVVGEDEENTTPGIALVHSQVKRGERYDSWQRARNGDLQIVVGTRSALFTPLPDVGLIILDEEHDQSYKQSADIQGPYYHARAVAEQMMRHNNGLVILGSATPSIETMYRAQRGAIGYLQLPDRIMGHRTRIREEAERTGLLTRYRPEDDDDTSDALTMPLPPVRVVDMRDELKSGNTDMFSLDLRAALQQTLNRHEQAILYLNRRGTATYVFCRDCGYTAACPNCDMPLTYHGYSSDLRCHHCGYQQPIPTICPECASNRIKYFGAGTQQVEDALRVHFPAARTLRWDADTAAKPGAHDLILQRFSNHQADILIGTQMVAKGLDLPFVTLVGVVSADMGLALPDFRAGERVFQLLTQVAGRAGRGLLGGRVILQTYQPEHYAVAAASQHDYAGFYQREIVYRRDLGYPPFRRMVRILFRDRNEATARRLAMDAASKLQNRLTQLEMTGTQLIGPAPCFFGRINQVYRWQIVLRGPDPTTIFQNMPIPGDWHVDVDPVDLL